MGWGGRCLVTPSFRSHLPVTSRTYGRFLRRSPLCTLRLDRILLHPVYPAQLASSIRQRRRVRSGAVVETSSESVRLQLPPSTPQLLLLPPLSREQRMAGRPAGPRFARRHDGPTDILGHMSFLRDICLWLSPSDLRHQQDIAFRCPYLAF